MSAGIVFASSLRCVLSNSQPASLVRTDMQGPNKTSLTRPWKPHKHPGTGQRGIGAKARGFRSILATLAISRKQRLARVEQAPVSPPQQPLQ